MNTHGIQLTSAPEMSSVSASSHRHLVSSDRERHPTIPTTFRKCQSSHGRNWIGESSFEPPRTFSEFYSRFPHFVRDFVRRRMMNRSREDQQDRESELLHFLMSLPDTSKFRSPGTNGYETGCLDRIMTFNPARCGGASPGQFLSYVNRILLNHFISLEQKLQSNPVCRGDTLRISDDGEAYRGIPFSKMTPVDLLCSKPQMISIGHHGYVWSHAIVQGFVSFIKRYNPELLRVLTNLSLCRNLSEAQSLSGLNARAFCRARLRLQTLYRCFQLGSQPPKQRRPYRDRVSRRVESQIEFGPHDGEIEPA